MPVCSVDDEGLNQLHSLQYTALDLGCTPQLQHDRSTQPSTQEGFQCPQENFLNYYIQIFRYCCTLIAIKNLVLY